MEAQLQLLCDQEARIEDLKALFLMHEKRIAEKKLSREVDDLHRKMLYMLAEQEEMLESNQAAKRDLEEINKSVDHICDIGKPLAVRPLSPLTD